MPAMLSSNSKSMLSNKRSASSSTEADCYNMSLGAGPLWWSWCPWAHQGRAAVAAHFPHRSSTLGCSITWTYALCSPASPCFAWRFSRGSARVTRSGWGTTQLSACYCGFLKRKVWSCNADENIYVPGIPSTFTNFTSNPNITRFRKRLHALQHRVIHPQQSLGSFIFIYALRILD